MHPQSSRATAEGLQLHTRGVQDQRSQAFPGVQPPCSLCCKHRRPDHRGQARPPAVLPELPGPRCEGGDRDHRLLLHQHGDLRLLERDRVGRRDCRGEGVARDTWECEEDRPRCLRPLHEGGYRSL